MPPSSTPPDRTLRLRPPRKARLVKLDAAPAPVPTPGQAGPDLHRGAAALLSADVRMGKQVVEEMTRRLPALGKRLRSHGTLWVLHLNPESPQDSSPRVVAVADQDEQSGRFRLYAMLPGREDPVHFRSGQDGLEAFQGTFAGDLIPDTRALLSLSTLQHAGARLRLARGTQGIPASEWWPPIHHVQLQGRIPQVKAALGGGAMLIGGVVSTFMAAHAGWFWPFGELLLIPVVLGIVSLERLRPTEAKAERQWQRTLSSLGKETAPPATSVPAQTSSPLSGTTAQALPLPTTWQKGFGALFPLSAAGHKGLDPDPRLKRLRALARLLSGSTCSPEARSLALHLRQLGVKWKASPASARSPESERQLDETLARAETQWEGEQRLQAERLQAVLIPPPRRDF